MTTLQEQTINNNNHVIISDNDAINANANNNANEDTNASMRIDNPGRRINWEYVSCNLCGRVDTEIYHRERLQYFDTKLDFTIVRCRNCGLVYTNPRISQHNATYLADDIPPAQQIEEHARAKAPIFTSVLQHIQRLQQNSTTKTSMLQSATLLDIGCGSGHFVAAANKAGYNACGLEPAGPFADYAQLNLGINVIKSDVTHAQIEPASFDIITAWDVIEHVADPLNMLRSCKTWLRPGGIAAFRFPSARWQKIKGVILHSLLAWQRPAFAPTIHLYFFSEQTFTKMAQQAGLKVIFTRTTPLEMNTGNTILDGIKYVSNRIIKTVETTSRIKLGNLEMYCTTE